MEEILKDLEKYEEPKFGSLRWLSCQAGMQKISRLIDDDRDIKEALHNLIAMSVQSAQAEKIKISPHELTNNAPSEACTNTDVMESLRPTDDEIGAKVEEYGFRVPYDGSNKFYDDEAIKHFRAGAEWARGFGRNAP